MVMAVNEDVVGGLSSFPLTAAKPKPKPKTKKTGAENTLRQSAKPGRLYRSTIIQGQATDRTFRLTKL